MTSGLDKVEAGVDSVVDDLLTIEAAFLLEVGIESRLDVLEDRPPAAQIRKLKPPSPYEASRTDDAPLIVVDKVTETRRVDHSQAESHTVLFNIFGNEKPRVRWQTGGRDCRGRRGETHQH